MKVTLEFDPPPEASFEEVRAFIEDALQWAGGCRDPRDPMFHSLFNVKVTARSRKLETQ